MLLSVAGYRVAPLEPRTEREPLEIVAELRAAIERQKPMPVVPIPIIGYASAGPGAFTDTNYWPEKWNPETKYCIVVTGECMAPVVEPGDVVTFDTEGSPREKQLVVAEKDDLRVVKMYYGDELRSLNEPPMSAAGWDILGIVVGVTKPPTVDQ